MKNVFIAALFLLITQSSFAGTLDLERNRIESARETEKKWCSSATNPSECRKNVDASYDKKMTRLEQNPEQYFYNREVAQDRKSEKRAVRRELNRRGIYDY